MRKAGKEALFVNEQEIYEGDPIDRLNFELGWLTKKMEEIGMIMVYATDDGEMQRQLSEELNSVSGWLARGLVLDDENGDKERPALSEEVICVVERYLANESIDNEQLSLVGVDARWLGAQVRHSSCRLNTSQVMRIWQKYLMSFTYVVDYIVMENAGRLISPSFVENRMDIKTAMTTTMFLDIYREICNRRSGYSNCVVWDRNLIWGRVDRGKGNIGVTYLDDNFRRLETGWSMRAEMVDGVLIRICTMSEDSYEKEMKLLELIEKGKVDFQRLDKKLRVCWKEDYSTGIEAISRYLREDIGLY